MTEQATSTAAGIPLNFSLMHFDGIAPTVSFDGFLLPGAILAAAAVALLLLLRNRARRRARAGTMARIEPPDWRELADRVRDLESRIVTALLEAERWQQRAMSAEARVGDLIAYRPEDLSGRVRALQARLTAVTFENDQLQQRVTKTEARLAKLDSRPTPPTSDYQFRRLRALLARELHPDAVPAEGVEHDIRTEIFKTVWPQVQEIERPSPGK